MSTEARIKARWEKAGHATKRALAGARISNLTKTFNGLPGTPDMWLRFDLQLSRERSRQMAITDGYFQSFLHAAVNNVLGPTGFKFQSRARTSKLYGDATEGVPDIPANDAIEELYKEQCRRENYLVSRNLTKRMADELKLRSWIIDGEVFVRTYRPFENETGYASQVVSADMVDMDYNVPETASGTTIRMGIEKDSFGAVVAYHFLKRPKSDYQFAGPLPADYRESVPAAQVRHIFRPVFPGQTRGIPWLDAAVIKLRMLGAFEEAAVVNARVGADRNLYFIKKSPPGYTGDGIPPNDDGSIPDHVRTGEVIELPIDVEPKMLDTRYPDGEIALFEKAILRGVSALGGVSYGTFTSDLSDSNFSGLRAGLNEERSHWGRCQQDMIEMDSEPEFRDWLRFALALQRIRLPFGKFRKFCQPEFVGRRWPSVNPLQDAMADVLLINNLLKSTPECIRERGGDPYEVLKDQQEFNVDAKAAGLATQDDKELQGQVDAQLALPEGGGS